jgi:phospholipid-binding lipoprotein MlaA
MLMTLLGGCATTGNPRDPLEPMNRAIYSFYDGVDKVILKPVAEAYRNVLPPFVRTGASNIFSNINEVPVAVNNLRQGKLADATSDAGRVVINTTLGVLGIIDGASEFGMVKHNEDFGQTLGYWGMDEGPFLMVPLLGPSNLRDTLGRVADFKLDPITYVDPSRERNIVWGSRSVSQRADFLDISKILETAALDPYAFLRDAYLQRRRNVVNDGSPPPEKDDDFEIKMKQPRTEPNDATARRPSGAAASAVVDPL